MSAASSPSKLIGPYALVMINVAIICSLRALPMMAEEGFALLFFFLISALFFLVPAALVSAELATGWPVGEYGPGGVYLWVKEALGQRWGFTALWLQWIQNVIWYPTALSFIAATVAYAFNPELSDSKTYTLTVVLVAYWGGTLASLRGMRTSGWISTLGVLGTMGAVALVIALGAAWVLGGGAVQFSPGLHAMIPDLGDPAKLTFLAGALVVLAGVEVSAVHAGQVKNPHRNYPRAMGLSVLVAVGMLSLGSLAIAAVIPVHDLSLTGGLMEAFEIFFKQFGIEWLVPLVAVLIVFSQMGEICSWIVGPSKGLFATAEDGVLPPFFQKTNARGMPRNILLTQAGIVTALALVFELMPSINSAYWILTALTAQLYILMYILLFISGVVLRHKRPEVKRSFMIPGGHAGMWLISGAGLAGMFFTLYVGFFPPSNLQTGSELFYEVFLLLGIAVLGGAALLIHALRKPGWKAAPARPAPESEQ